MINFVGKFGFSAKMLFIVWNRNAVALLTGISDVAKCTCCTARESSRASYRVYKSPLQTLENTTQVHNKQMDNFYIAQLLEAVKTYL